MWQQRRWFLPDKQGRAILFKIQRKLRYFRHILTNAPAPNGSICFYYGKSYIVQSNKFDGKLRCARAK